MWQIVGQKKIISMLERGLEQDSLSHAYLLVGPAHVGKMTLAVNLAQALNCQSARRPCGECPSCRKIASGNHADVQVISLAQAAESDEAKSRAEIGIDAIKDIIHASNLPPFEGSYRVYIIDEASHLSNEAANCLLKTLEEPIGKVIFILLTVNDSLLLPTIISRCQKLELSRLSLEEILSALIERWHVQPERAGLLARLSHGCPGWARMAADDPGLLEKRSAGISKLLDLVSADYNGRFDQVVQMTAQFSKNRETVYEMLDLWLDWWHDLLLIRAGCDAAVANIDFQETLAEMARAYTLAQIKSVIYSIQTAAKQLKMNGNSRLVLEVLMLDIPRIDRDRIKILTEVKNG